jgi:hypothetical protein
MVLFQANIKLSAALLEPGNKVDITVDTKCNSYVGILGVDQSLMMMKNGMRNYNFNWLGKFLLEKIWVDFLLKPDFFLNYSIAKKNINLSHNFV